MLSTNLMPQILAIGPVRSCWYPKSLQVHVHVNQPEARRCFHGSVHIKSLIGCYAIKTLHQLMPCITITISIISQLNNFTQLNGVTVHV